MECEYCNRELRSWTEETPDEFGVQRWESSDPCKMGCHQNKEVDFASGSEYYAFRMSVAKTLTNNATEDIKITKTLESLDEWVEMWWNEAGRDAFVGEN